MGRSAALCPLCARLSRGYVVEQCADCGGSFCHQHIAYYGSRAAYLCRRCASRAHKAGRLPDSERGVRPAGY